METKILTYNSKNISFATKIRKDFTRNKNLYLLVLPVLAYYLIFYYKPMYGTIIAFQDYSPIKGIAGSPWVGLKNFADFFDSYYFFRVLKNTLLISFYSLVFEFPAPIVLALLINEVRKKTFKKAVQTFTYLPHFISLVVICGLIKEFTVNTGVINDIIALFGGERVTMLQQPELFRTLYISTNIWQDIGWSSIIYLAALTGIDPALYEASNMDGAGRWKQTLYITIPGITPTIVVLFIIRIGNLLNLGFEKIILLYNPIIYTTSDIISTFVYRKGIQEFNWSFSTAVDLFNGVINFVLLITANWISKKVNENSLW